ncbi:helix-turn-helix transcriptional regulator [Mycetocola miduiensis]|uniref:Transcriptional regulator, AlpA family n=1 Tax=Mycetocola miduiensis TaxID=995034 RepID=A0A1I4ZV48_9MICO|nr:helix-turn-helix domain-containing protein [Mycetocola miduiensis]SFN54135.1 transcriptional regulator, AlpA family [Mycetocola miduiensis]
MSTSSVPTTYPPARFIESLGDYITVDELAEYLQLSKETIYHWRLEGTGPKATKLGKHLRYSRANVEAWLKSRTDRR